VREEAEQYPSSKAQCHPGMQGEPGHRARAYLFPLPRVRGPR
jgi:hypothetical protein